MKRKIVSGMLVLSMAASLMAGCGQKEGNAGAGDAGTDSTAAAEGSGNAAVSDAELPVVRVPYTIMFDAYDEAIVEEALNEIMVEKAQAKVDLVGITFGEWSSQLNLLLSTDSENSLDLFSSFWYSPVSNLASNGQAMALNDLLESDGQGIKELFAGDLEDYLKCGTIDGQVYGIPCMYAYCTENQYLVRVEDAQAAGINWDEVNDFQTMSDTILKLKEANPDKYFVPGAVDPYWVPKSIDYLGDTNYLGVLLDPTNSTKVENFYESEYFTHWLDCVKQWSAAGAISPDPQSNTNPSLMNLLMGVTDGTPGYAWDAQTGIKNTAAQNGIEVCGTAVSEALSTTSDATTYMWHISTFSKNPEAAMRVLNVLYTDAEAANIVANGLEGHEYVLNENGQMSYPMKEDGTQAGLADLGWSAGSMAYWPNVMLCKTWDYEDTDVYEKMAEKNKTCNRSLALGFSFDSEPVRDQITACNNVVSKYYSSLTNGVVDIDEVLPQFQAELKTAGIDEIIDEKQSQLDAWLAENK